MVMPTPGTLAALSAGVGSGVGVSVGTGVAVAGTGVAVGGMGVAVGGAAVATAGLAPATADPMGLSLAPPHAARVVRRTAVVNIDASHRRFLKSIDCSSDRIFGSQPAADGQDAAAGGVQ